MKESILVNIDTARAYTMLGSIADQLGQKRFHKVVARVQNRVIAGMRTEVVRQIRSEYNVPASDIRAGMSVYKATSAYLQARLTIRGRMGVELIRFSARETAKGVSVRVLKSSRAAPIKAGGNMDILETKKNKASATWIAKGHVLARTAGKDHPIMLWGPSFIAVLGRQEVSQALQQTAEDRFIKRLQHEAAYELQKLAGKS